LTIIRVIWYNINGDGMKSFEQLTKQQQQQRLSRIHKLGGKLFKNLEKMEKYIDESLPSLTLPTELKNEIDRIWSK